LPAGGSGVARLLGGERERTWARMGYEMGGWFLKSDDGF